MTTDKLALTPYDLAILTAVAQGGVSGVHRAQHPERAGEPALEKGIGQGLTAALGHAATALPTAYLTRNLGGVASGTLATLAGLAGGAALPAITDRVRQFGSEMTGGPLRGGSHGCGSAKDMRGGSRGNGGLTQNAMEPLSPDVSMSATAQPPPGSGPGEMGSMGPGFKPNKPKVHKEKQMKDSTTAQKKEEAAEKTADDSGLSFTSKFLSRWRKVANGTMQEKIDLFKNSGFNAMMKRSEA